MRTNRPSNLSRWKALNAGKAGPGMGLADDGSYYPLSNALAAKARGDTHVFTGKECIHGHVAVRRVSGKHVGARCTACDSRGSMPERTKVRHMIFEPIRAGRATVPEDVLAMSRGEAPSASAEEWFESMVPFYQLVLALRLWENNGTFAFPKNELTVDHMVPLSAGGAHELHNLQLLVNSDNARKWNRMSTVRRVRLQNWHSPWAVDEARGAFTHLKAYTDSGLMSIYDAAEEFAQVLRDLAYGVPGGPDWLHPERLEVAA